LVVEKMTNDTAVYFTQYQKLFPGFYGEIFLTNKYEVAYGRGTVSGGGFSFANYEILGTLDANNMAQYLAFVHEGANINFYKNGRYVAGIYDGDSGLVVFDATARRRIAGYGFVNWQYNSTYKYPDTSSVYYSGIRLSDGAVPDTTIFDTYTKLFNRSV
jgi:hypothetical protein